MATKPKLIISEILKGQKLKTLPISNPKLRAQSQKQKNPMKPKTSQQSPVSTRNKVQQLGIGSSIQEKYLAQQKEKSLKNSLLQPTRKIEKQKSEKSLTLKDLQNDQEDVQTVQINIQDILPKKKNLEIKQDISHTPNKSTNIQINQIQPKTPQEMLTQSIQEIEKQQQQIKSQKINVPDLKNLNDARKLKRIKKQDLSANSNEKDNKSQVELTNGQYDDTPCVTSIQSPAQNILKQ